MGQQKALKKPGKGSNLSASASTEEEKQSQD